MERTIFLFFLCTAVKGDIGKPIFVSTSMTWVDAQNYCRRQYTDLFFVDSQSDQDKFLTAVGKNITVGWIGLERDASNKDVWKWSGGGYATYTNWAEGQPDNYNNEEDITEVLSDGKWNDNNQRKLKPFYCIDINVVEEKKTWEEALEHCRDTHTDLPSLHSETKNLLAQKVIQNVKITEGVWIGLRYLADRWLWVNNDPLVYEAWPQGDQDHHCPTWKRCGALTKGGLWENRDCQEKLNFICI